MGRTPNGENGYMPGVQCPFTPSRKATWTDAFNRLLETEGVSRNRLTEILIQEALENRTKRVVTFDHDDLTTEEAELLQNPMIQKMIISMIRNFGASQGMPNIPNPGFQPKEKEISSVVEARAVVETTIAATKEGIKAANVEPHVENPVKVESQQKNNVNMTALERFKKIRGSMSE